MVAAAQASHALVDSAELQSLRLTLEPIVSGPELASLPDGYVPRGPETVVTDAEGQQHGSTQPQVEMEAPLNRYAGVIYAARFFVTRVGFLRSVKRIMVLSSNHLTIVDPYTEEVKERYPYDAIKEITVASDSGGSNVDRSFTVYIGKSLKETYTCRNRQHLLSAYYQLRERASTLKSNGVDLASLASASSAASGVPSVVPSTAAGNGMYFDNLFQLCGKTFTMTKLSHSQSSSVELVKVPVLLAVRATSLDRLDTQKKTTLSSILLIDIMRVTRVTSNSNELLILYNNGRCHRYWCDSREPFIQAIANNMRSWLGMTLHVNEISGECEEDGLRLVAEETHPVMFETPVLKVSKNPTKKLQLRYLSFNTDSIYERDPVTRKVLRMVRLEDVYNVVIYPSKSSSYASSMEDTPGNKGKFALELRDGRTRRYVCLRAMVCRRDEDVKVGLQMATSTHDADLRRVLEDVSSNSPMPDWLTVPGAASILSPKEARSLFLSNLFEVYRMKRTHLGWSTEETRIACKEGTWGSEIHPEWEDILLRKLVNLHLVPNLVNKDTLDQIFRQLEQFNRNVPVGGLRQRDRRAFACIMKLLESFKEYSVAQLKSPSSSDSPIPTTEFQVALLLTVQRLLCTRGVFEEVPHSQYKNSLDIIMELVHSPIEEVSFAAALVIKYMVINYSETRSMKSETANRRALFSKYHCNLFVSRAFDVGCASNMDRSPPLSPSKADRASRSVANEMTSEDLAERSIASALAYSKLGVDYLVTSLVLQTLEVCLSSGKKATPERVARELLRAMRVEDFMRHYVLFLFNRSLSFSIAKCSSILVKVHVLEQPSELVELIQDFARRHGALLWQLYLSLNAPEKPQHRISSQLVALLTHENARSSGVIRRIFPHSLLDDIPICELEFDEFGRFIPTPSFDYYHQLAPMKKKGDHLSHSGDLSPRGDGTGRSKTSNGLNTRAKLVRNMKCVVLLPEFFERVKSSISEKDLVWGAHTVRELVRKLESELAQLDVYRLKYQCYLYTDPLAIDQSKSTLDALNSDRIQQEAGNHGSSGLFPFELLHSPSQSRLALEILRGTISSSNRFAEFLPVSFLLDSESTEDGIGDHLLQNQDMDESDEHSGDENQPGAHGENGKHDDGATSHAHNDHTQLKRRNKRKKRAKHVPRWYVSWNANEYHVEFDCLRDEVKVGAYYLTNLLNDRGVLKVDIEDPETFMMLLYYRLLAEEDSLSHHESYTSEIDKSDIRLLVLKVMIQVYERHYTQLSSLAFLNHMIRVSMINDDHKWPLVVRGNIVLFLDRVLSSAVNVTRFVRDNTNVRMILDLLREVKPSIVAESSKDYEEEYKIDDATPLDADIDEDEQEESDGPVSKEDEEDDDDDEPGNDDHEDVADRADEALDHALVDDSLISSPGGASQPDDEVEETMDEAHLEISRFTVVAEHCGAMSTSMIMQTCLSVLCRLIECHTADEEGTIQHDVRFPKHGRLTHFEGCAVCPVSQIKRWLCEDQTLRFLVGLLDCPNRVIFKKCLGLIRLLVRHNESIIPRLHATGLFYYLLRFAQDVEEMTVAARLISHIHLRQSRLNAEKDASNKNEKGIFSPDPLTRICLKSWLVRLLPVSMVAQLLRHGPKRFAQALFSEANNPEVVWNVTMRNQMVSYIEKFMARHTDANGVFSIAEDEDLDHEACIALVQYPKEVHALQCYQYYLHNLLDEEGFPDWPINDEEAFLVSLMDSVHRWVHPHGKDSSGASVDGVNAKQLSVKDAVQLLDAISLLLRRFPDSACITSIRNFHYILEALEKCVLELRRDVSGDGDATSAMRKKMHHVNAFSSAIRVVNLSVALSEENSIECSSGLGLRVLCGALQFLFSQQEALRANAFDVRNTTHSVLEALAAVLSQPNGRVSAAAQSLDLLPCLTHFLLNPQEDEVATELALHIVNEMGESSGEMAEVLLLQLAEHGILWYLALLTFTYQPIAPRSDAGDDEEEEEETEEEQPISINAARALERILRATAKEETISVFVKRMQDTIVTLFTRALVDVLRRSGAIPFLQILVSEVREPHVMWTDMMRKELITVAKRAVQFHMGLDRSGQEVHKVFELPPHFMYTAQKEELCVAGIYVNFFNENPQNGIQAQIAGTRNPELPGYSSKKSSTRRGGNAAVSKTVPDVSAHVMHGLLSTLAHDIAGVRAQPQVIEAVLLHRMLPVATAIRHLIQFTSDMDIQVVRSDGLLTLWSILDHEAQPLAFSFSCAPLLQLRCIECLHALSFSSKCVDSLASLVPQFVKSAFQIVYKNLAKTDASTEGQLARLTLQLVGNVCLIPSCIDSLVKGMNPSELSALLPQVWLGDPHEVQLLLCVHMIPLKRHTAAATQFAKAAVSSQLASSLLSLLSSVVPKTKLGDGSATKAYAARFLSVLSSNPGSGGAISSLLVASRAWEAHGDSTQATSDDLRRLLMPPHAPALLKADHANPHRVGTSS